MDYLRLSWYNETTIIVRGDYSVRKVKTKIRETYRRILYLFRPATVIVTCLVFMIFANLVGILLLFSLRSKTAHEIILAIITGITASVIVAIIIEMANNFQRNSKRWQLLSSLYSSLLHYSSTLAIATGHYDSNKAHLDLISKIHRRKVAQGDGNENDTATVKESSSAFLLEDDGDEKKANRFCNRVSCVFSILPDIIPQIDEAYHSHEGILSRRELDLMGSILLHYTQIKKEIEDVLLQKTTVIYGVDPRDPGDLVTWLSKRVQQDLEWPLLFILAEDERESERDKIAAAVMRSGTPGLSSLGIELRDSYVEEDIDDWPIMDDFLVARIISTTVYDIDNELLDLQNMIKAEPGFGAFYSLMKEHEMPYQI